MNIQQIYIKFGKIGTFTFATIEDGRPRTRIAHLFAFDDDGLYFRTMNIKPFYKQLKKNGKVAIGGIYPNSSYTLPIRESPLIKFIMFIKSRKVWRINGMPEAIMAL